MRPARILAAAAAGVVLILGSVPPTAPQALTGNLQGVVPAVPGQLHVTAAGDYSSSSAAAGVLSRIGTIQPDLHFALGDLSYATGTPEQDWCDFVTTRTGAGFPFELVAGNHESNGQNGYINNFSACLPNQLPGAVGTYGRQYYVDVPEENPLARFIVISPGIPFEAGNLNYSPGSSNYTWTSNAVDSARAAGIPWVVVNMHTPCLSVGQYSCASGEAIANLLLTKKVDLVLNGHEHIYQRSKQLATAAGCTGIVTDVYNPACVRDADNSLAKGAGTVFTTLGTGGVALRDVNPADPEAPYFAAWSGLNSNPSHGLLDLQFTATTLTAGFLATNGSFTDSFSIAPAGSNTPPQASFTSNCTGLTCTFDGAASQDPDGSITGYLWDFGDGTSSTSQPATKTYASAGSRTASLTVTDNDGATAATSQVVTVTAPGILAADAFGRTVSNSLGTADTGGAWATTGTTSNYSVAAGTGRLRLPAAGNGNYAYLPSVSSAATELYLEAASDKPASGSGLYLSVIGRRIAGAGEYRCKVVVAASGAVNLSLVRTNSTGAETTIQASVAVAGVNYAVGDKLSVRLQVTGTGTTTVRARVWETGTPEPATWQRSATDTSAALQGPGAVGFTSYLSGSATNAPVTVLLDNLQATVP
ncbi:PKD domain-containing protein [Arthrobacter cupressi]